MSQPYSKFGMIGISSTIIDNRRETSSKWWEPSKRLIESIRDYQYLMYRLEEEKFNSLRYLPMIFCTWIFIVRSKFAVLRHRFWSVVTGADIPLNTYKLGRGLLLPHPNGVVVHPDAKIGPNCLIFQQVTIGTGSKEGLPQIEGHVDMGAGCKILGGITIGAHSIIGANAVVTKDVPPYSIVTGIPGRIRPR